MNSSLITTAATHIRTTVIRAYRRPAPLVATASLIFVGMIAFFSMERRDCLQIALQPRYVTRLFDGMDEIYIVGSEQVMRSSIGSVDSMLVIGGGEISAASSDPACIVVAMPSRVVRYSKRDNTQTTFESDLFGAARAVASDPTNDLIWVATQDPRYDVPDGGMIIGVHAATGAICTIYHTAATGACLPSSISVSGGWMAFTDMEQGVFQMRIGGDVDGSVVLSDARAIEGIAGYQVVVARSGLLYTTNGTTVSVVNSSSTAPRSFLIDTGDTNVHLCVNEAEELLAAFGTTAVSVFSIEGTALTLLRHWNRTTQRGIGGSFYGGRAVAYIDSNAICIREIDNANSAVKTDSGDVSGN